MQTVGCLFAGADFKKICNYSAYGFIVTKIRLIKSLPAAKRRILGHFTLLAADCAAGAQSQAELLRKS